ncbi:MAG: RNA polymerase factor sigma-32 [Deltaproteobacteria bacterium]|nr:RNA polymerase factor sigma-32 [Deltaproteobacteria bacterium]
MAEETPRRKALRAPDRERQLPVVRPRGALPPAPRSTLDTYIDEIRRVPLLSREEEMELARRFASGGDRDAARRLVEANLRFVVKIAHSYKHYNVKLVDLIQEGNIGLMKAVQKFQPDRGYRLISYAVWWIKAYMQNYIIRSWSMVRVGTAAAQRQLFFRMQSGREGDPGAAEAVGEALGADAGEAVGEGEVVLLPAAARRRRVEEELRVAQRDFSLDADIGEDGKQRFVDMLPDPGINQDESLAREQILEKVSARLAEVVGSLSDKERDILQSRLLSDTPETLQDIGDRYGVSRERIRQIETQLKKRLAELLGDIEGVEEIW